MFETETTINQFLLSYFQQVVPDLPADRLAEPAPGNGHPPLWVLGHLAICAELGESMAGAASLQHPEWMAVFGPGSSDTVADPEKYSKDPLVASIVEGYSALCLTASQASPETVGLPHGISLLENSALATRRDVISHLLTSHFSFHLAQLSAWRRAAGHGPLF